MRATGLILVTLALLTGLPSAEARGQQLNRTIETLEAGHPVFGLFTANHSLINARSLATSDLDFIFIDMEHAPLDFERLQIFLLGMTDAGRIAETGSTQMRVTPLVRIPQYGDEQLRFIVKQVLDMGAYGVVFPFISTREEAVTAVSSMRYPPGAGEVHETVGTRGSSAGNARWYWGANDYTSRADTWPADPDGELLAVLQIEDAEGVDNIDEIASVEGVGAIFIGPADLGNSLAASGRDLEEAIQTVLAACLRHDVPCGLTTGAGSVTERLDQGFNFVTIGYWNDAGISTAPGRALEIAREHAGRDGGDRDR